MKKSHSKHKFYILHVLGPLIPTNLRVNPDPRHDKIGFEIRWRPPRFYKYDTRIEKYNITWKAVHTKLTKNAEQEETKTATIYQVLTDTRGQLTKGETYEITVVSVSYDTYSVSNGSNQINDTISKFIKPTYGIYVISIFLAGRY